MPLANKIENLVNSDAVALGGFNMMIRFRQDGVSGSFADLTAATNDLAQTLSFTLPVGTVIHDVAVKIKTELSDASDGTFDNVTLTINKIAGTGGAAVTLMSAKQVGTTGTLVAYLIGTSTLPAIVQAADATLDLVFDPVGAFQLVNLDAGEILIFLRTSNINIP